MAIAPVLAKRGIALRPAGRQRVFIPEANRDRAQRRPPRLELRLSHHRDRPRSRLRRDSRPRAARPHPLHLPCRSREGDAFDALGGPPRPGPVVGAAQGASCFGPAYEFAIILDTALRARQDPRPRADDLRHARSPISAISGWTASATPRACSKARCASVTSNGSPTPR